MYSTENLFLVHDGSESTRADKVERIVTWEQDLVLNHLRVCNENAGGASNCGKCAKCVRTAIPLYILGLWDRARTFPDKSIDHWEKVVASERHLEFAIENLEFAQKHGDKKMTAMLTRALKWSERREKIMRLLAKRLRLLIPLAIRVKPSSDRLRALASSAATGKPPSRH
jgi:hypothetical protein